MRKLRRVLAPAVPLAGTLLTACVAARPAPPPAPRQESSAFVKRLGRDTVAVEQYRRVGDRIEGREVVRTPRTAITDYVATLAPDGAVSRVEVHMRRPGEPAPYLNGTIEFGADSAVVAVRRGDSTRTFRVAAPRGSVPWVGLAFALYEPALQRARTSAVESSRVALVPLGSRAIEATIARTAPNTLEVRHLGGTYRVTVDGDGRITAWDGTASTLQIVAERQASADVEALAESFAARERGGQPMGLLSPRDSVRVTMAGARLAVDYSRPLRRGRQIFGNVVPWGQVWRTGANAATAFRTDRDVVIGGVTVPAGAYTLWTIPSPSGWTLIVNKQTGQWGTEYHAEQDLARIPMRSERLPEAVEQFTIAIEPAPDGAVLVMRWDDTGTSVPIVVK